MDSGIVQCRTRSWRNQHTLHVQSWIRGRVWGGASGVNEGSRGFRSGFRSVRRGYDGDHHTIFADNFPDTISKRELFLEFGYDGWINDIYISRKQRRVMKSPFAFIRFNAYASAMRAIKRLNGSLWKGKTISVSLAKFKRSEKPQTVGGNGTRQGKTKWVWRVISKENKKDRTDEQRSLYQEQGKGAIARKVVETTADESKRDILDRSLMGVMMKPMNLQSVGAQIHEKWKGEGEIVCRDVGPYKCLLTFESPEIRDVVMSDLELANIFDEIRPHWEIFSSHSRRVWIEVLGLPVIAWSATTFEKVAKLWGNLVLADYRTEHCLSFTVARLLIDSYEWSNISEWVRLKVDGREIEIHVREFGGEIYSIQTHPCSSDGVIDSETLVSESVSRGGGVAAGGINGWHGWNWE
ncbi:hypothetical protein PIB30_016214 [Stylosanthes scabra]|uniref:RRM domain-containing protein n=1 Tax=Stylosanthes scabra TaxID=79078 RepID=A0ABU6W6P4_9FABA|nr:hypothetical protein [Stylosanthes scabra]